MSVPRILDATWTGPEGAPAVALVHGLAGSHRTWAPVVPLLEDRRVAAVDLIGGRGIEEEAEALEARLRESGASAVTVAGHSMGGLVATALVERSPGLVSRLVLVNTPPTVAARLTARSGSERMLRLPVVGALLWARMPEAQVRKGLRSAFARGAEVPETFVTDVRATSHRAFAGSTAAIERYVSERPLHQRLARFDIPIEVVFGLQDRRVDPESLAIYDSVPRARVRTIETAGHTPPWEAPEIVADAIRGADPPGPR